MIRLVILGAGTAIPRTGYSPAGSLVQIDGSLLLFDIGPGTVARLAAAGFDHREIEAIFLTHHHSDHTLDLVTLLQVYDSTPGWSREKPLRLFGGRSTSDFYERLMSAYPGIAPATYPLEIREIEDEVSFPGWRVKAALTGHTPDSLGYRLESAGKSVVFSGDAILVPELVELAQQADVFICECSFPGEAAPSEHLAARQVGRLARQAAVKRLLLVHLYPPAWQADVLSEVRAEYPGPVEIARDGYELQL